MTDLNLFKDKDMKKVVLEMNIILTLSTQEIRRQNKCQMRFLERLFLK